MKIWTTVISVYHYQYSMPLENIAGDIIKHTDSGAMITIRDVNGYVGSQDPNLLPEPG